MALIRTDKITNSCTSRAPYDASMRAPPPFVVVGGVTPPMVTVNPLVEAIIEEFTMAEDLEGGAVFETLKEEEDGDEE